MSTTSLLDVHVKPERVDDAPAILRTVLADTRAFDGCLSVTVIQDHSDPTHFVAVEVWESLAHDTAYREWRKEAGVGEMATILAAPPVLTVAETRDDI